VRRVVLSVHAFAADSLTQRACCCCCCRRAVYACKTMNKQKITERQREKLIMNERNILVRIVLSHSWRVLSTPALRAQASVNHPFIVRALHVLPPQPLARLRAETLSNCR
jgi:hypothetical protein